MSISEFLSPLFGRLALAWFFFAEVGHYGGDWSGTVALMRFAGMPVAPLLLLLALVLLILGSLSLLIGFHTRHGALMLFAVTAVTAVTIHAFWQIAIDDVTRQSTFELFSRDIAICGGLLLLVGMGAGPLAVDNFLNAKKKK